MNHTCLMMEKSVHVDNISKDQEILNEAIKRLSISDQSKKFINHRGIHENGVAIHRNTNVPTVVQSCQPGSSQKRKNDRKTEIPVAYCRKDDDLTNSYENLISSIIVQDLVGYEDLKMNLFDDWVIDKEKPLCQNEVEDPAKNNFKKKLELNEEESDLLFEVAPPDQVEYAKRWNKLCRLQQNGSLHKLEETEDNGDTYLMQFVKDDKYESMLAFLRTFHAHRNASLQVLIDKQNNFLKSALVMAVQKHSELKGDSRKRNCCMIKLLRAYGANVNQKSKVYDIKITPLQLCCQKGDDYITLTHILCGPFEKLQSITKTDLNILSEGYTALHYAILGHNKRDDDDVIKDCSKTICALINYGADVTIEDQKNGICKNALIMIAELHGYDLLSKVIFILENKYDHDRFKEIMNASARLGQTLAHFICSSRSSHFKKNKLELIAEKCPELLSKKDSANKSPRQLLNSNSSDYDEVLKYLEHFTRNLKKKKPSNSAPTSSSSSDSSSDFGYVTPERDASPESMYTFSPYSFTNDPKSEFKPCSITNDPPCLITNDLLSPKTEFHPFLITNDPLYPTSEYQPNSITTNLLCPNSEFQAYCFMNDLLSPTSEFVSTSFGAVGDLLSPTSEVLLASYGLYDDNLPSNSAPTPSSSSDSLSDVGYVTPESDASPESMYTFSPYSFTNDPLSPKSECQPNSITTNPLCPNSEFQACSFMNDLSPTYDDNLPNYLFNE